MVRMEGGRHGSALKQLVHALALLMVLALAAGPSPTAAGRVLAAFPLNAKSHFIMYEPLLKELAKRGHRVTVIGHFPQKKPLPNYRDISLKGTLPQVVNNVTFDVVEQFDVAVIVRLFWQFNVNACDLTFNASEVQRLLTSKEEYFDLVITEIFSVDCMAALAYKFNAPLVSMQSSVPMPWAWDRMGNPDNPSYMPSYFGQYSDRMSLRERLENVALGLAYRAGFWYFERQVDALCRRYVGDDMPPLGSLVRNTSLILVNSHFSLNHAAPMVPGVVEVAGMHLTKPQKLPQDLLSFVEGSPEGVVYFSLGSMMRSETMPPALMSALLAAFRALPQRVVWKIGREVPPGLEPNKFWTSTWVPQMDLLYHPKVRAFLTHGGLLSMLESVSAGVPMVGMPLHSDQYANMRACVRHGVARVLDHKTTTRDAILAALRSIIEDSRYRLNAQKLSVTFRDRPQTPLETAVFWTEYVMRHKGAPQLRSAAVDLEWYQLWLLDVAAVLAAAAVLLAVALWLAAGAVLRCIFGEDKKTTDKVKGKSKTS